MVKHRLDGVIQDIYINPDFSQVYLEQVTALDFETSGLSPITDKTRVLALGTSKNIYVFSNVDEDLFQIKKLLLDNKVEVLVAHNAKFDAGFLLQEYGVKKKWFCTMLASQILTMGSELYNHGLKDVLQDYGIVKQEFFKDKDKYQKSFTNNEELSFEQLMYAAKDVAYLLPLRVQLIEAMRIDGLLEVAKLEFDLIYPLLSMELKGCLIDIENHRKNIKTWEIEEKKITIQLDKEVKNIFEMLALKPNRKINNERNFNVIEQLDLFGSSKKIAEGQNNNINYGSSQQLKQLFVDLEQPLPVYKDSVSFGENSLTEYVTQYPTSIMVNFIEALLKRVKLKKVINTYGEKLIDALNSDGRIRTNYIQIRGTASAFGKAEGTSTGRLACKDYNIANIPTDNNVRESFIADPGYSFVDCDMTGQEVAIAAVYSRDDLLLRVFKEKFDHHSFLASKSFSIIFNTELQNNFEVVVDKSDTLVEYKDYKNNILTVKKKNLRNEHKTCLFAMFYGAGADRIHAVLAKYINACYQGQECKVVANSVTNALRQALPKLNKWLQSRVRLAKEDGYLVTSKLGRRRKFDDVDKAYGDAMNACIQGTGAEAMKILLIKLYNQLYVWAAELNRPVEKVGWLVFSIYDQAVVSLADDLIWEIDENGNKQFSKYVKQIQEHTKDSLAFFLEGVIEAESDVQVTKYWKK